jgi:hypothetical protein
MEGFEDEDWSQKLLEDMQSEIEFFLSQGAI